MRKFRIEIDEERCKGCELCVQTCPETVLEMSGRLNGKGYDVAEAASPERCTGCAQCAVICPDAAIEIAAEDGADQADPS